MDRIDLAMLAILQTEGRISGADLGRRVRLSQPAVSARLQRLERTGVITGYRALVDPARLGLNLHAVVRLRTTHAHLTEAIALFDATAEITQVYRLTGEDCFLVDIHAPDARRLEEIVDRVARFGPVTTSLVLREYPSKPIVPADGRSRRP
ncbi:Lrp/AsnC family transcriptional regulator [Nocardia sp. NPDC058705]|uniref:Lrp/AsnC family transcriptional regulator n=1 Tax=Nocardia sp. NPDC058705 TaxID=3346609 RepID=UPI0036C279B8